MSYFVKCSNLEYNSTNMFVQHFPDYNSALNFAEQKVQEGYSTTLHSGSTHVHVHPVDEQEESSTPDPVQPLDPNPVQPVDGFLILNHVSRKPAQIEALAIQNCSIS